MSLDQVNGTEIISDSELEDAIVAIQGDASEAEEELDDKDYSACLENIQSIEEALPEIKRYLAGKMS